MNSSSHISPVSNRWFLWAALALLGVFAALTALQFLRGDAGRSDPARVQELAQAKPAEVRSDTKDWPQWRGPNRDGVSSETGLLTTWPAAGPRKLWEKPLGKGFSSMAVARGRVFTMFQDGDHEAVICFDAAEGAEIWRYRYRAQYTNSFGDGPRATPTVAGDLVYTVGATGMLHCLEAFTAEKQGVVRWQKDLLRDFQAENLTWGVSFSPLVEGDLLYLNPGGTNGKSLVALDKRSGEVRWQSQDDVAGYSSPLAVDMAGTRQVLFFTETGLVAVTPDAGKVLWRFPWQTQYGANIATPLVLQDYVFVSSGYGKGCAMVKVEKNADTLEARLVYKNKNMKTHFSSCVRYRDHIYGFNDSTLTCLDFRTGEIVWEQRDFEKGSLTIADGHLFVLGEYGRAAVAPATPKEFRETGSFQFSTKKCWTVPVVSNGRLYLRDESKIACYGLTKDER